MRFSGSGISLIWSSGPGILKQNAGEILDSKVCVRVRMAKITLGITGLPEVLGRDYGIEEPYWGPSAVVY